MLCLLGAGAVVTEGTRVPDGSLVLGVPGKVRGPVGPQQKQMNELSAAHYVEAGKQYAARYPG